MKLFLAILGILLLTVIIWLGVGRSDDSQRSASQDSGQYDSTDAGSPATAKDEAITTDNAGNKARTAVTRFSGSAADQPASQLSAPGHAPVDGQQSVAQLYQTSDDLAQLWQQLQQPQYPEDYYYRYRILKECNDLRLRGIDEQLNTCERMAEHTARGAAGQLTDGDVSRTAADISEQCFAYTERCGNLDFDSIGNTPAAALLEAIQQGSVLARAASLYQLSESDPELARTWLAATLNEYSDPELLRHGASFLRASFRLREQPFYGVSDNASMLLAERALDLTACRLENGCGAGGHFMLERCNYLPGCLPWQSYEQWLYQSYTSSPEDLTRIVELSQDYQQFLINRQAELLVFPELAEADGNADASSDRNNSDETGS